MEKKLAVIVDNNKITTEVANIELCSSACDVAKETCSSQNHDACGDRSSFVKKTEIICKKTKLHRKKCKIRIDDICKFWKEQL